MIKSKKNAPGKKDKNKKKGYFKSESEGIFLRRF